MAHTHDHHHHRRPGSQARLVASIAFNLLITIAEVVGGLLSGSLSLLSDALHNFSDTVSLGISLGARRMASREANGRRTFGYRRAEIIGAFINLVTLVLIALFLIKEAIMRFMEPRPVDGSVMLVVALIGLAANVVTAALLYRDARGSLNVRSAFVHIVADALSSVGVVLGGLLILLYDLTFVDPLLTLAIAVYMLYHSYDMLQQTVDILMESTPPGLEVAGLIRDVQILDPVQDMHHVHVWQLDEAHTALEAHIVISEEELPRIDAIKHQIKDLLAVRFEITHSTLEFELAPCAKDVHAHCFQEA